jgi:integrase
MLTDTALKQIRPGKTLTKLFDGNGTGLHVLCHPGGAKTFAMKYRHPATGKDQTFTLGKYPAIGLKDARLHAANARTLLAKGLDPRQNAEMERAVVKAATVDTFELLAQEWIQVRGARWSDSYRVKIDTMLKRHLFPALGSLPITQLTAHQLLAVLRPIEASRKTDLAHTLMQQASAIFRFAVATQRASADPAAALRGALAPHKQENFPAVTTPVEFAAVLQAIDIYQGEFVTRAALAFTALTFQRSQSIRFAQWDQIDWNAKLWRIPAEIMKMKEAHLVPLSRQAIELLQALAPLTGNADYIFPSLTDRHKPISENTMLYALVPVIDQEPVLPGGSFRATERFSPLRFHKAVAQSPASQPYC